LGSVRSGTSSSKASSGIDWIISRVRNKHETTWK
jgi:hypothetical protein